MLSIAIVLERQALDVVQSVGGAVAQAERVAARARAEDQIAVEAGW